VLRCLALLDDRVLQSPREDTTLVLIEDRSSMDKNRIDNPRLQARIRNLTAGLLAHETWSVCISAEVSTASAKVGVAWGRTYAKHNAKFELPMRFRLSFIVTRCICSTSALNVA